MTGIWLFLLLQGAMTTGYLYELYRQGATFLLLQGAMKTGVVLHADGLDVQLSTPPRSDDYSRPTPSTGRCRRSFYSPKGAMMTRLLGVLGTGLVTFHSSKTR